MIVKRIGVTLGEPTGIGPEIVLKALAKTTAFQNASVTLFAPERLIEKVSTEIGFHYSWQVLSPQEGPGSSPGIFVSPVGDDELVQRIGRNEVEARAKCTIAALDAAIGAAKRKKIDVLLTAPIDKKVVRALISDFDGHTEYLAFKCEVPQTVMLLDNTEMRIVPLTQHIPLREVTTALNPESIVLITETLCRGLTQFFRIEKPRLAFAGINPHAGEIVESPEEETILLPAIEILRSKGHCIEGPFAADSLFPLARVRKWDALLSPYHDQALVAAKYPGLEKVLNITLGLPFLRISPGHGVAYDLAGKNQADTRSMERAFHLALEERRVGRK